MADTMDVDAVDDEDLEATEAAETSSPTADNRPGAPATALPDSLRRREEAEQRREQTLAEFLELMEDYRPVIPDSVTTYYLEKAGFVTDDVRVKRLIALAAQKFVADVAQDAMQFCKMRMQNTQQPLPKDKKGAAKSSRQLVLTMEDLSNALKDHGVNAAKPDYYM